MTFDKGEKIDKKIGIKFPLCNSKITKKKYKKYIHKIIKIVEHC